MHVRTLLTIAAIFSVTSLPAIDYLTEGGDAARTGWIRNETSFTTGNVGETKLLWKAKLDSRAGYSMRFTAVA